MKEEMEITVRQMTVEDLPAVVALQNRVYPNMTPWSLKELNLHLKVFPEGQLVAVDKSGKIVGSSSSLIIDWDDYAESAKWSTITGSGSFSTHNPLGKTLYGADMSVDPDFRRMGIGTLFYNYRKKLVQKRGLKRMLTGGRLPGYSKVDLEITAKQYVKEVTQGKRKDPILNFQLKNGLVVLDIIPEYLKDTESRGFATLLEWLNPEYVMDLQFAGAARA